MAKTIYAPDSIESLDKMSIFCAGTIDQGKTENWVNKLAKDWEKYDIILINPQREDWDENFGSEEIQKQVKWGLEAMDKADIILVNILPDSESPISIAETYRHAGSNKMFVSCPEKFYRYDNVKAVCEHYKTSLFNDWGELKEFMEGNMESLIDIWGSENN